MSLLDIDLGLGGYGPQLFVGAGLTLQVWGVSVLLGTLIGLIGALARLHRSRILRGLAATYVNILRGVPDLLVVFLLYYGGSATLNWVFGRYIEISAFLSGAIALALVFGAYTTEIFRGAIQAVPAGQREAAQALGMKPFMVFLLVVLPQAWRYALPAFGSQSIILIKGTSLISIIGLEELMRKGKIVVNATAAPFNVYLAIAAIYLSITMVLVFTLKLAERRLARGYGAR